MRYVKWASFVNRRYTRGYPVWCQKGPVYKRLGKELDPGAEPPQYETLLSPPPPPGPHTLNDISVTC